MSSKDLLVKVWEESFGEIIDPSEVAFITLTNTDENAIVDAKNYTRVSNFKWFLKRVGPGRYYVATSIHKEGKVKTLYLHRYIIQPSPGMDVHHVFGNVLDNREERLEERESIPHRSWHLSKYSRKVKSY